MATDRITFILEADTRIRDQYALTNPQSMEFPAEIAKAMVVGRELLQAIEEPEDIAIYEVDSGPRLKAFAVVENNPVNQPATMAPDEIKAFMLRDRFSIGQPGYIASAGRDKLGFEVLQHWILRAMPIEAGGKTFTVFEPWLFSLKPELRGRVGPDSYRRLEEGVTKLGFDAFAIQAERRTVNFLLRGNFSRVMDIKNQFGKELMDETGPFLPDLFIIKPLSDRIKRANLIP